jgi:competence ComEA-like helix-hairpin-helix protein
MKPFPNRAQVSGRSIGSSVANDPFMDQTASSDSQPLPHGLPSSDHHTSLCDRRDVQTLFAGLALLVLTLGLWSRTSVVGPAQPLLPPIDPEKNPGAGFSVNINTANADELALLPLVGPTLAQRIVEERQRQGPFASVDELSRTPGIGPHRVKELRPFIVVVNSNLDSPTNP